MAPGVPSKRKRRTAAALPATASAIFAMINSSSSASGVSCTAASRNAAALLTQPASVPTCDACSTAALSVGSSAASPASPAIVGRSVVQSSRSASRSSAITCPWLAKRSAMARPTPRPPPVTTYVAVIGNTIGVTRVRQLAAPEGEPQRCRSGVGGRAPSSRAPRGTREDDWHAARLRAGTSAVTRVLPGPRMGSADDR